VIPFEDAVLFPYSFLQTLVVGYLLLALITRAREATGAYTPVGAIRIVV